MHAAWTLLLARASDSQTATAAALAIAIVVFAPFAALGWDVEAAAIPYGCKSSRVDAHRLLCESVFWRGRPRAKEQDLGLCPAALR